MTAVDRLHRRVYGTEAFNLPAPGLDTGELCRRCHCRRNSMPEFRPRDNWDPNVKVNVALLSQEWTKIRQTITEQ